VVGVCLRFAFISPIVALYGIFALAISAAGPSSGGASFWCRRAAPRRAGLRRAGVTLARWRGRSTSGRRRLLGTTYGWFAGWVYMWTLVIAMATVAIGRRLHRQHRRGGGAVRGTLALIALAILLAAPRST